VDEGASVAKGDVLLRIDETFHALRAKRTAAELERAKAQVNEAHAALKQAEAQRDAAQAVRANRAEELERIDKLKDSGNAMPIEYDRIVTAFRTAEADLSAAEAAYQRAADQCAMADAQVDIARAAADEALANLERCVVRSPVDGRVNRFMVERGEFAVAAAPLVEVVRLDQMKMNVEVAGTDLSVLDNFSGAEVAPDAAPDRVHAARLHHVAPKVDPVSKRFRVELIVDNQDRSLLAGMYGKATLYCGELTDRIVVPAESVFKHYGADFVLVVDQQDDAGTAALRRVTVQPIYARLDEMEVLDGLAEGDNLIVTRRRGLRDGVSVDIVRRVAAPLADVAEVP
jgi:multidrug efflux pump subunit AcrA (membrane-fusion protein)